MAKVTPKSKAWDALSILWRSKIPYCQKCGTYTHLQVHHAIPKTRGNGIYFNEENLIVMCRGCHNSLHRRWTDYEKIAFYISIFGKEQYERLQTSKFYTKKINKREFKEMEISYKERLNNG